MNLSKKTLKILLIISIVAYPLLTLTAYLSRGFLAFGGEALIPLLIILFGYEYWAKGDEK